MFDFVKKNKWILLASFALPSLLLATGLAIVGIYWGSSISILAGDAYHQYVAVLSLYRDILHSGGQQGLLYTFTNGLGLNLYAFSAYYMGSFFMPLTFFFNVKNMPDALYLITLLKFGCIGLSAFISLKNMYKSLKNSLLLGLATAFALMSFLTSQVEIIMWLDVFIWLPLIVWGLHSLQDMGRRRLYFVTLTILFIQNYYFGFMIAIFLGLYFLVRATWTKWSWRKLLDFLLTSALAALTSLVMLLPMYLDLKANNSNALSNLTGIFTENSQPLDIFAKNFVGAYDTTQYNAVPMIYVGLLPLVLAILFFFVRSVRWRTKWAFAGLLAVLIASFYFQALDLFWQGLHSPNMFLHRYAFLFSWLIIVLAAECLLRFEQVKLWQIFTVCGLLLLAFGASVLSRHYSYLRDVNVWMTLLFGLAYLILLISIKRGWLGARLFRSIVLFFMLAEAGVNGYYQLLGIQNEWHFAGRVYYNQQTKLLAPLAQKIQTLSGQTFARAENTNPDTANDGMKYGYNAISQFSSVRNSNSSHTMNQLGFHTDSTYLNLRYPGNTLLMDSIFAIKYNINQFQPGKFDFSLPESSLSNLTENQQAQSLGIFVPGGYSDAHFSDDPLQNQTNFVNHLTKSTQTFFKQFYTTSEKTSDKIAGSKASVSLTDKNGLANSVSVTYGLTTPAHSQCYLRIPDITYLSDNSISTNITISQVGDKSARTYSYNMSTNDTGSYFNLGSYAQATKLSVTVSFPGNSEVTFAPTSFWALDTQAYQAAMAKLKENPVQTKPVKNGAVLDYTAKSAGQMFVSLPYDKGWSVKIDGHSVKFDRAQSGFIKFDAPAGQHQVKLSFLPQGLKAGLICFVTGLVLFVLYDWTQRKAQK